MTKAYLKEENVGALHARVHNLSRREIVGVLATHDLRASVRFVSTSTQRQARDIPNYRQTENKQKTPQHKRRTAQHGAD